MTFSQPLWLLAGLLACAALVWMWHRHDRWRKAALARFVSAHLRERLTRSVSLARQRVRRGLTLAALALLCVAIAGPQAGFHWEQVTRRGNDIVFAVDTSRSMLTPDVKPNRLARAKLAVADFVSRLDGDSVSLVAFAGSAFVQSPLTLDYGAFDESLDALDTHIIPRGGTDIASAIREAQATLEQRKDSDKILILVTDGEDLDGNALAAAKDASRSDGMKIDTVGVGTANGDLIPLPADQGGGFLKDADGNPVRSRLDEAGLRAIATATGGMYEPLGAEGQGLDAIYRQALAPLAKHDLAGRRQRVYNQLYQWPLAAALLALLASMLVGTRRRSRASEGVNKRTPAPTIAPAFSGARIPAAATFGLLLLASSLPAHASTATAASAYTKGQFAAAAQDYAAAAKHDPRDPVLQYDLGTAAYRAGQYKAASQAFQASLAVQQSAGAKRLAEQQDTFYNLGNTLYRTGQKIEQTDPQQTIQTWTQSVKAYDAALQLRSGDVDSKFNRDFVQRKLAQLQQKQSEQQKQQQKQQKDKNSSGAKSPKNQQGKDKQGQGQPQGQSRKSPQQGKQGQSGKDQQPGKQDQSGKDQQQGQGQQQGKQGQDQQSGQQGQQAGKDQGQSQSPSSPAQNGQAQPKGQGSQTPPSQANPSSSAAAGNPAQTASSQSGGQQTQASAQAAGAKPLPGQMSAEEARELLDSLKGDERRMPVAPVARNGSAAVASDTPVKDW
jgi:Ca-activated chloride channel family protein